MHGTKIHDSCGFVILCIIRNKLCSFKSIQTDMKEQPPMPHPTRVIRQHWSYKS